MSSETRNSRRRSRVRRYRCSEKSGNCYSKNVNGINGARCARFLRRNRFGELERLITQKVLDVIKTVARDELKRENWLRIVARESDRSYKEMRAAVLEFLDADVSNITPNSRIAFLNPLIVSWDVDLASFGLEIVLNRKIVPAYLKKFEFVEAEGPSDKEPGLQEFLKDRSLSGDATPEEVEFLKQLRSQNGRQPTALYYHRELQNLRDALHFRRKERRY